MSRFANSWKRIQEVAKDHGKGVRLVGGAVKFMSMFVAGSLGLYSFYEHKKEFSLQSQKTIAGLAGVEKAIISLEKIETSIDRGIAALLINTIDVKLSQPNPSAVRLRLKNIKWVPTSQADLDGLHVIIDSISELSLIQQDSIIFEKYGYLVEAALANVVVQDHILMNTGRYELLIKVANKLANQNTKGRESFPERVNEYLNFLKHVRETIDDKVEMAPTSRFFECSDCDEVEKKLTLRTAYVVGRFK